MGGGVCDTLLLLDIRSMCNLIISPAVSRGGYGNDARASVRPQFVVATSPTPFSQMTRNLVKSKNMKGSCACHA